MGSLSTIVALSSGAPPSGVAVIRLSGPHSFAAAAALAGPLPSPRQLALRTLAHPVSGEALDRGLVAAFPAPHSFTGEDCVELQVHGSPAGIKAILRALTGIEGIELAGAGDFTRRAFENGKLDLTAIEGLGDLLAAETETQRKQALARLEGGLHDRVALWRELLLDCRAEIEARLDFCDEDDVPFELPGHFVADLERLRLTLAEARDAYAQGRIVREGFRIVLAGAPNSGKSSLLNRLAGSDLAIVTAEAGTTRDIKEVAIDLDGQLVLLVDTAGLRKTDSLAEGEGVRRARRAIETADLVLWLLAPDVDNPPPGAGSTPLWRVGSKCDLRAPDPGDGVELALSAHSGEGVQDLLDRLKTHIESRAGGEPALVSHLRDRQALDDAGQHVASAIGNVAYPELCAEDLRRAADDLAGLIGLMDNEAVLDRLFAGFCIGK